MGRSDFDCGRVVDCPEPNKTIDRELRHRQIVVPRTLHEFQWLGQKPSWKMSRRRESVTDVSPGQDSGVQQPLGLDSGLCASILALCNQGI